jgi:hypothetical protein
MQASRLTTFKIERHVRVEFQAGTDIRQVASEMERIATTGGIPVLTNMNGLRLFLHPGEDAQTVIDRYHAWDGKIPLPSWMERPEPREWR